MGQKINSNIFRINYEKRNKNSKYLAKDQEEHSTYTFDSVEIKNYLNNLFAIFGLLLHSSAINFSANQLTVSIAYYISIKGHKFVKNSKMFLKISPQKPKTNFTEILLESLTSITNRNIKIFITLLNLNKQLLITLPKSFIKTLKKKKVELRKFSNTYFFSQTINIVLLIIRFKSSAKILTDFLILQLKILKKPNYFIYFFKQTVLLFLKSKFSKVRGLKLVINGRTSKRPRADSKKILIGNIPLQTIRANIDYNHKIFFTKNGSVGINVWIF